MVRAALRAIRVLASKVKAKLLKKNLLKLQPPKIDELQGAQEEDLLPATPQEAAKATPKKAKAKARTTPTRKMPPRDAAKEAKQFQEMNTMLQDLERTRKLDKAKAKKLVKPATGSQSPSRGFGIRCESEGLGKGKAQA